MKADGTGFCLEGSGRTCEAGDYCVNGSGLDTIDGKIEGPACTAASDCRQEISGHLNTVCVRGTGSSGSCVPLCQYKGDPTAMKCVTHPDIGIWDVCNRIQVRTLMTLVTTLPCSGIDVATWACAANPAAPTADEVWTLDCMGGRICPGPSCLTDVNSNAKLSISDYLAFSRAQLTYTTVNLPGGSSSSGKQCGTDCDCGHCSYCESGACRYGGEGPYGCYRGCD